MILSINSLNLKALLLFGLSIQRFIKAKIHYIMTSLRNSMKISVSCPMIPRKMKEEDKMKLARALNQVILKYLKEQQGISYIGSSGISPCILSSTLALWSVY